MESNLNRIYLGVIICALMPILSSFLFYTFMYEGGATYFQIIVSLNELHLFSTLLSVSVLPNLLLFFIATKFDYLQMAKGMLYPTGVYVVVAALYRLIF